MPTLEDVHNQFVEKGAAEIGRYYQKGRIDKLQSQPVKSKVEGGYCGGVCMDWIRRALVGAKLTFKEDKNYQDHRAAEAQILLKKEAKEGFSDAKWAGVESKTLPYKTQNSQLDVQLVAKQQQYNTQVQSIPKDGPVALQNQAIQKANKLADEVDAILGTMNANTAEISKLIDEWNAWLKDPLMCRYWQTFAGEMNKLMELQRQQRAKMGPSRYGFDKLKVITAIDQKEYSPTGMTQLIDEVTVGLSTSHAAHVGIYPSAGGSGHAIAVLRVSMFNYVFFDPNFGTYRLRKESLRDAVPWLFREGYPSITVAKPSDAHSYEVDGKVKGDYTIFAGPYS